MNSQAYMGTIQAFTSGKFENFCFFLYRNRYIIMNIFLFYIGILCNVKK